MIKQKVGALFAALLFLTGCDVSEMSLPELPALPEVPFLSQGPSDTASMFFGLASVKSPDGFCIDRSNSQLTGGFAVIVPCVLLDETEDLPPHLAFITVQMDGRGTAMIAGTEDYLRDQLESDAFQDILSDPKAQTILETDVEDGAVAVHYRIEPDERTAGLSDDVWRAFADVDGRLITISLRGYEEAPLTVDDGRTLLYVALRVLRDVNA